MVPQISTGEVSAESNIVVHRLLTKAMQDVEPGHAYMLLRDGDEGKFSARNVTPIFEEDARIKSFYQQMGYVDLHRMVDLFGWQHGLYPVDAVFTSRVGVAPLMAISMGSVPLTPMPVIMYEPRVYGPTDEQRHNMDSPYHLAIRAAAYATCIGLYMQQSYKDEALTAARHIMAPGVIDRWDEHSFVLTNPVEIAPREEGWVRDPERKRLLFAGRLNTNKNWPKVMEVFASIHDSRPDVDVWLHSGTGAFDKLDQAGSTWHRTSEKLPRDDYWGMIYGAHVGAYMSTDEGANATVQEMLLAGVAMALPDRPWVRKMFTPLEYPYLASGAGEMKVLVDWLLDHYEEADRTLAPIREFIRREHSYERCVKDLETVMEFIYARPRPQPYRVFRNIVRDYGAGEIVPFSQARMAMSKDGRPQGAVLQSSYACYRAVADLDDLSGPDPMLDSSKIGGEG